MILKFFILFNIVLFSQSFSLKSLNSVDNFPIKIIPPTFDVPWSRDVSLKSDLFSAPIKKKQVNCLGLGTTISKGFEMIFRSKDTKNNPLIVNFWISSRRKPEPVEVTLAKGFNLNDIYFNVYHKTVFIIHGFLSHGRQQWVKDMERAFLMAEDVNVVAVDWSAHGNTWNYYQAAVNAKSVGRHISKFLAYIMDLIKELNPDGLELINWGPIHMIGHSLGAHICGIAANKFEKISKLWKITRITGLDPAQPCFKNTNISLDITDGKFIDVIHTNAEILLNLGLGLPHPLGHIDFYPDGGKIQIGCSKQYENYFDYLGIPKDVIDQAICSHGRSHIYFTESIIASVARNGSFWGHPWDQSYESALKLIDEPCDSKKCVEMGINADKYSARGSFFVVTSGLLPYYDVNTDDKIKLKKHLQSQSKGMLAKLI